MLDRATLHTLAQHPEQNDPLLNVALAEEGDFDVLAALVASPGVGPDALSKIAERVAAEGESVGHTPEAEGEDLGARGARRAQDEEEKITHGTDLDAKLVGHPRADRDVRDAILVRHAGDAYFALAAALHPAATHAALDEVARWPSATPLHDRPWLALLDGHDVPPLVLGEWAADSDPLAREAAARILRDPALLATLARDPSRRVRRAVASNPHAGELRARLAQDDPACEVRARARSTLDPSPPASVSRQGVDVESARFRSAIDAMRASGRVAADVSRALVAGPLDAEGARLAARALEEAVVAQLVTARGHDADVDAGLAAGIALRDGVADGTASDLVEHCVRSLAGADKRGGVMTGKARLSSWLAGGVAQAVLQAEDELLAALATGALVADRMVIGRLRVTQLASWAERAARGDTMAPIALLEIAWRDPRVPDEVIAKLPARMAPSPPGAPKLEATPELEVDLDPRLRSLPLLEKVGVALVGKAALSPRAALALVALEPRRVRYVLSALPQWKGVLTGANVARVLKAHAGALSAAGSTGGPRKAAVAASWTQRKLDEVELAVALSIGDLGAKEAASRLASGHTPLAAGTALAAGMEARAALVGPKELEPLLELLARGRSQDAGALAAWLLVEGLDRARSAAAIAAALDAPWASAEPPARGVVARGIAEALATLERRSPGRLAEVTPQTARGKAALVSGLARAYRALGGMSVDDG